MKYAIYLIAIVTIILYGCSQKSNHEVHGKDIKKTDDPGYLSDQTIYYSTAHFWKMAWQLYQERNLDSTKYIYFSQENLDSLYQLGDSTAGLRVYFGLGAPIGDSNYTELYKHLNLFLVNLGCTSNSDTCNDVPPVGQGILSSGPQGERWITACEASKATYRWKKFVKSEKKRFHAFQTIYAYNFKWSSIYSLLSDDEVNGHLTYDSLSFFPGIHSISEADTIYYGQHYDTNAFACGSQTIADVDQADFGWMVVNLVVEPYSKAASSGDPCFSTFMDFAAPCPRFCGNMILKDTCSSN